MFKFYKRNTIQLFLLLIMFLSIFSVFPQKTLAEESNYYDETQSIIRYSRSYTDAYNFHDGLALVIIGNLEKIGQKYGFINKAGKLVIPAKFDYANDFSEGLARVQTGQKYGYIDKTGRLVISINYNNLTDWYNYREGLARVKIGQKYGFINKTGKLVIPATFDYANDFSEGLACVGIGNLEKFGGVKYGYINKTGKLIIPTTFEFANPFSEDLARVHMGFKYGFINKAGKLVISAKFDYNNDFSEGLARVQMGEKCGYINKTGRLVIPATFDYFNSYPGSGEGDFSEGLAIVKIGQKYGYINKTGKLVIPATFDKAYSFSEDLAGVCIKDKQKSSSFFNSYGCGYINKTGKLIISATFEENVRSFSEGLAHISFGEKLGYIDKTGKLTIDYMESEQNSKLSLLKYYMSQMRTTSETYAVDHNSVYAPNFEQLFTEAVEKKYFHEFKNPLTNITGLNGCCIDISTYNDSPDKSMFKSMVIYKAIPKNGKIDSFNIFGTDENGKLIEDKGKILNFGNGRDF